VRAGFACFACFEQVEDLLFGGARARDIKDVVIGERGCPVFCWWGRLSTAQFRSCSLRFHLGWNELSIENGNQLRKFAVSIDAPEFLLGEQ